MQLFFTFYYIELRLTGKQHFANFNTMIELLESEGIVVEDNKIANFDKHFWQPDLFLTD